MTSFSKKSVALIIFATILCGFSYVNVAKAATTQPTFVCISDNQQVYSGQTFTYNGNNQWVVLSHTANDRYFPVGTGYLTAQCNMPNIDSATGVPFSTEMTAWDSQQANATNASSTFFTDFWGKVRKAGDITLGIIYGPYFLGVQVVLFVIGQVVAGVFTLAGALFDQAVIFSLFHFRDIFQGLDSLWALFRDTINIFFIFILIYIAIKKIIGASGFDEKKALGNLILDAILINFSLFISKFFIDAGNIFAVAFYNRITDNGAHYISTIFLDKLNLVSLFSANIFTGASNQASIILMLLLKIVIVVVAIYIFFFAAFMFIGRTVMLIYLAITSPIAFVGGTIPQLKSHADDWWKEFSNQVLVAPIFLLFMFLITQLIGMESLQKSIKASTTGTGDFGVVGYFYFILIILLLLKALKETKKLSGKVGEAALNVAKVAVIGGVAALAAPVALSAGATSVFSAGATAAAAEAAAAGKTGFVAAARARLAFAGEKIATSRTGKFVSGEYEKEPGYLAKGLTMARGAFSTGLKETTGGKVDIIGLQKALEKNAKEMEAKLLKAQTKQAQVAAVQQTSAAQKQAEGTQERWRATEAELQDIATTTTTAELGNSSALEADRDQKKVNLDQAATALELARASNDQTAINTVKVIYDTARNELNQADQKIASFKKEYADRERENLEDLAKQRGFTWDEITKEASKTINIPLAAALEAVRKQQADNIRNSGILENFFSHGVLPWNREDTAKKIEGGATGEKTPEQILKDYIEDAAKKAAKGTPPPVPPASSGSSGSTTP